jgi:hypothetical protein
MLAILPVPDIPAFTESTPVPTITALRVAVSVPLQGAVPHPPGTRRFDPMVRHACNVLAVCAEAGWLLLASQRERRAVRQAALVANTEPFRRAMRRRYPPPGCGSCDHGHEWRDEGPVPVSRYGPRFVVAYAGTIYLDRDPRTLFRAAARLVRELALTPADFGIRVIGYVGRYDAVPVSQIASEEGWAVLSRSSRHASPSDEALTQATMLVSLPSRRRSGDPDEDL